MCHHARRSPPTTCTPASRSPSTPARRSSRSPGASLLRQHHPDVAGAAGLERAKRINVAHDWLSDPDLRARYDRERGLRRSVRDDRRPRRRVRDARGASRAARRPSGAGRPIRPRRSPASWTGSPPSSPTRSTGSPAPSRRRSPSGRRSAGSCRPTSWRRSTRWTAAVDAGSIRRRRRDPGVRDAVEGYATELVLGPFLDELLSEPFRERARERLTRGWEAAVGQPRYGPNGVAVAGARSSGSARLDAAGVAALAATAGKAGLDGRSEDPWPPGTSPEDDEALRVSSVLAARDAAAAIPAGAGRRGHARRAPGARPRGSPTCSSCATPSRRRRSRR